MHDRVLVPTETRRHRGIRKNGIEVIVFGTYGRDGIEDMTTGSVAEPVVRTSNGPVLAARRGSLE